jgi:peptidoglycan-associated lipoprotein
MNHPLRITLCAALLSAWLAGCGSAVKLDDKAPVVDAKPTPAGGAGAGGANSGANTAQSAVTTVDASKINPAAAGNLGRVVYFDYDSYVLKDEFRPLIEGYARVLNTAKTKKMVIEGHTDERGGREYNLALGQRRAEAVAKSLVLLGAADSQLEAVSFGKERPVSDGHDEAAWAKNRRAELKDR